MSTTQALQITSISTALLSSGGIATLTLFDAPLLLSQPASRSLPLTRWLFSRGSHLFPTSALLSSTAFLSLAYSALPASTRSLPSLLHHATQGKPALYLAAAALTLSIMPWTAVMVPTNFELIRRNEELGGSRSARSAEYRAEKGKGPRSPEESVRGKEDLNEMGDGSGPQGETRRESTEREDEEVRALLERFRWMNMVRAVLMGLGGIVGLVGALA